MGENADDAEGADERRIYFYLIPSAVEDYTLMLRIRAVLGEANLNRSL